MGIKCEADEPVSPVTSMRSAQSPASVQRAVPPIPYFSFARACFQCVMADSSAFRLERGSREDVDRALMTVIRARERKRRRSGARSRVGPVLG